MRYPKSQEREVVASRRCQFGEQGVKEMVYRYKAFDGALCGDNASVLETLVNTWMDQERPRIRHMCQSTRGEHIFLSFVYEDIYELEQRMSAQAQKGNTGAFSRLFESEPSLEDQPTSPHIPATPLPCHQC